MELRSCCIALCARTHHAPVRALVFSHGDFSDSCQPTWAFSRATPVCFSVPRRAISRHDFFPRTCPALLCRRCEEVKRVSLVSPHVLLVARAGLP